MDELALLFFNFKLSAPAGPPVQKSVLEPNALRRTPPEIRAIIFRYVLDLEPLEFEVAVDTPANQIAALFAQAAALAQAQPAIQAAQAAGAPGATPGTTPGATLVTTLHVDPEEPQDSSLYPTPGLLVALRTTTDLYGEALEVFYAENPFILDITIFQSFSQLKAEAVGLIRHLVINLESAEDAPKDANRDFQRFFTYPRANLRHATRLQKLSIYSYSDDPVLYPILVNGMMNWTNLRIMTLIGDRDWTSNALSMETQLLEFLKGWMKEVDHFQDWACHTEELSQDTKEIWPGKVTHWMAEGEIEFARDPGASPTLVAPTE